jgi:hypothetical protein
VADRVDSVKGVPVFNRVTTLKDSWGKWTSAVEINRQPLKLFSTFRNDPIL